VAAALRPGAPFLLQMLNYERILRVPVRALPVNVRPLPEGQGEGELVFLRILSPRPDGHVDFHPIALALRPGDPPTVEVQGVKHHVHHAWTRAEILPALETAGFEPPRIELQTDSLIDSAAMVAGTDCLALLPEVLMRSGLLRERLLVLPVKDELPAYTVALYQRARTALTQAARALAAQFEREAQYRRGR